MNITDAFLAKISKIHEQIVRERGGLYLFALVKREESIGKWDLILSASWAGESNKSDISYVAATVDYYVSKEEKLFLSRIVFLNKNDSFVVGINGALNISKGRAKVQNYVFNGVTVDQAYVFTSTRTPDKVSSVKNASSELDLNPKKIFVRAINPTGVKKYYSASPSSGTSKIYVKTLRPSGSKRVVKTSKSAEIAKV